jgi:uncharacterized protein YndB with AHSA1/START domain
MATANTANIVGDTTFTTPTERELTATRIFDAPPETVWKAHTDRKHVPQWMLGPEGNTMPVCEIDLRRGGRWHFRWRGPEGDMDMEGEYQEIKAPELLVNTERWGGSWPETINILTLTGENGKTRLTSTMLYPSREAREKARDTGMEQGWSESYDRLDDYLPKIK